MFNCTHHVVNGARESSRTCQLVELRPAMTSSRRKGTQTRPHPYQLPPQHPTVAIDSYTTSLVSSLHLELSHLQHNPVFCSEHVGKSQRSRSRRNQCSPHSRQRCSALRRLPLPSQGHCIFLLPQGSMEAVDAETGSYSFAGPRSDHLHVRLYLCSSGRRSHHLQWPARNCYHHSARPE